ncbi:hypothetical protein C8R48DRAFT_774460 [Suillus tomentosus]|nr:hypothetical protein C8R48DRAFT_774460 [Suillus tomentosus]
MSEQLEDNIVGLRWNDSISVALFTVVFYEYLILFDKEVIKNFLAVGWVLMSWLLSAQLKYVWNRPWSLMSCLYLVVRYLGLSLSITWGCWGGLFYIAESPYVTMTASYVILVVLEWGASVYFCFAEAILIWRLYAICNQSKLLLYVYVAVGLFLPIVALLIGTDIYLYSRPHAFSVQELITPNAKYCTFSFNIGPMSPIYMSIPIVCYDVFLVALAAATLARHFKEQREYNMRPNTYMVMIVRYHIMYFVLNLTNQILMVILWAHIPTAGMDLSELFSDTMPFILAPRLIISIWDTHAQDDCLHVSTTFEDCLCLTSPPRFQQHEMVSDIPFTRHTGVSCESVHHEEF